MGTCSGSADFVVVGAGIVGLTIARELRQRFVAARIVVLEKEGDVGRHASGRNSGVLHAGLYYTPDSLKARVCTTGARLLAEYCAERGLPMERIGKVVLPVRADDDHMLDVLAERARANGAQVELLDASRLRELEPAARSLTGRALHSPNTAVFDPRAILARLVEELREARIEISFGQAATGVDAPARTITVGGERLAYGHLFNAAGLQADLLARASGLPRRYAMLPFKGLYRKLAKDAPIAIKGLIYPVPDLAVPFLGVHFTPSIRGDVYVGPTAVPAFGREQYHGLESVRPLEALDIGRQLVGQYMGDHQGFRAFAHAEALRFLTPRFVAAGRALVPDLTASHLVPCDKVGIRAQLLDLHTRQLVMDFLVTQDGAITHILNAVSPGFTGAFAFAKLVVDGADSSRPLSAVAAEENSER